MEAPLSAKAAPASSVTWRLPPVTASMPPASNRLRVQVARSVKSAGVPSVARNTRGLWPCTLRALSLASRSASKASDNRTWGSGSHVSPPSPVKAGAAPPAAVSRSACQVETFDQFRRGPRGAGFGNRDRRFGEMRKFRDARDGPLPFRDVAIPLHPNPRDQLLNRPGLKRGDDTAAGFDGLEHAPGGGGRDRRVRRSTYQDPAAASATLAMWDSSWRIVCVLRAMRRAKPSGSPSADE